MVARLVVELKGVGLAPVVLVRERGPEENLDLEALRQEADSVAIFDVVTPQTRLTVLVPVPGSTTPVKADLTWPAEDSVAESMVGVQAVELLRAGLIQAKAETLGKQASRMTLAELALAVGRPGGQRSSLYLGTRGGVGTFSAGPQASVELGARVPVVGRLMVTGGATVPYVRAKYTEAAGDVFFGLGRVELGAAYRLLDPQSDWVPDVGVSVGLSLMSFSYEPSPLFLGRDEQRFLRPTAGLRTGIRSPRVGPIGGRADLHVDGSAPVAVGLDGVPAGTWGPAEIGLGISLDVLL